jgi:hypothetical protein
LLPGGGPGPQPSASHPAGPGFSHPAGPGFSHPASPGFSHPAGPGFSHPASPGFSHPAGGIVKGPHGDQHGWSTSTVYATATATVTHGQFTEVITSVIPVTTMSWAIDWSTSTVYATATVTVTHGRFTEVITSVIPVTTMSWAIGDGPWTEASGSKPALNGLENPRSAAAEPTGGARPAAPVNGVTSSLEYPSCIPTTTKVYVTVTVTPSAEAGLWKRGGQPIYTPGFPDYTATTSAATTTITVYVF